MNHDSGELVNIRGRVLNATRFIVASTATQAMHWETSQGRMSTNFVQISNLRNVFICIVKY
jgi:hypothetical protein